MEKKYKIKIDKESFVSVADLRKNLSKYSKRAKESPVIVINKSKPEYALVDIEFLKKFEEMEEEMEGARIMAEFEEEKKDPSKWLTKEQLMKNLKDAGLI
jgi:prevent-host-death family protein